MYNPFDYYFKQAQKKGYKARSAFKLEEIQQKFHLFDKNIHTIVDVGCAPGSRMQYASSQLQKKGVKDVTIVGFDIKPVTVNLPDVHPYQQDVTDQDAVKDILSTHELTQVDMIMSDMAPNTIGLKDIDAIRAFDLLEQTEWLYSDVLKKDGKFVTKVFMGPGFDEYVARMKKLFGGRNIKVFKPASCRKESKETYIVKM